MLSCFLEYGMHWVCIQTSLQNHEKVQDSRLERKALRELSLPSLIVYGALWRYEMRFFSI